MKTRRGYSAIGVGATLILALGLSACAASSTAQSPSGTVAASVPTVSAAATPAETPGAGAVESFRAWLAASRAPDVDAACAVLDPVLQARMIAELNAGGATQVSTCEEMIAATAALYRALGQSADVDITVDAETATDATLFVTYLSSGDCGTVVMSRPATEWIITEQSEECDA